MIFFLITIFFHTCYISSVRSPRVSDPFGNENCKSVPRCWLFVWCPPGDISTSCSWFRGATPIGSSYHAASHGVYSASHHRGEERDEGGVRCAELILTLTLSWPLVCVSNFLTSPFLPPPGGGVTRWQRRDGRRPDAAWCASGEAWTRPGSGTEGRVATTGRGWRRPSMTTSSPRRWTSCRGWRSSPARPTRNCKVGGVRKQIDTYHGWY